MYQKRFTFVFTFDSCVISVTIFITVVRWYMFMSITRKPKIGSRTSE